MTAAVGNHDYAFGAIFVGAGIFLLQRQLQLRRTRRIVYPLVGRRHGGVGARGRRPDAPRWRIRYAVAAGALPTKPRGLTRSVMRSASAVALVPVDIAMLRAVLAPDADVELRRLANDRRFRHRDAARSAIRFRASGDVADLVAIADDPHPCAMIEVVFALASAARLWLNWVPMPGETITAIGDHYGSRRSTGEVFSLDGVALSAAEPPSAMTACRQVLGLGPLDVDIEAFPAPDIRRPLERGRHAVWRYDGATPVPAVAAPSPEAVHVLHEVAAEPWPSPLAGYLRAAALGELPLDDLLGLLAHMPPPGDIPRWRHLATSTPTFWYRFMQPWVCLGILHHAADQPWTTSTRREVLIDLAFGVEDWVSDAALFALVVVAYREPARRREVRKLVRARLDAARRARRTVTITDSLAQLMLITPGCTTADRTAAKALLNPRSRWWRRPRT